MIEIDFEPTRWLLIVGDEAVNAEDHKAFCGEEEPVYRRYTTEYAQREREREAQRIYLYSQKSTVTTQNNQPLQKVTKSLYIVIDLGQLPFMQFT